MARKSAFLPVLTAAAILLAAVAVMAHLPLPRHSMAALAVATPPSVLSPGVRPVAATSTVKQPERTLPPDSTLHVVTKGESLPGIVHRYLPQTRFLTGSELEAAIRAANLGVQGISPTGIWPKPGSQIVIPSYQET